MPSPEFNLNKLKNSDLSLKSIFGIIFNSGESIASEFIEDGKVVKWSREECRIKILKAASKILGVFGGDKAGDYIILKMPNSPLWPVMFWAILAAGFKPVLVDSTLGEDMTNNLMNQSGAIGIIDSPLYFEAEEELSVINWENEMAMCTSGTTSTSKIFTYSGEAICYQLFNFGRVLKNEYYTPAEGDKVLAFLPFNHVFGFIAQYLAYTFYGAAMVYVRDRAPETLMKACRDHGVTHILAVPLLANNLAGGILRKMSLAPKEQQDAFNMGIEQCLKLQRVNFSEGLKFSQRMFGAIQNTLFGPQVKVIICGGSHLPNETTRILSGIGYYVVGGYGMTEIGIASCETSYEAENRLTGSCGEKFEHMEYKLVNLKNENEGELLVRGKSIHTGMLSGGMKVSPDVDAEGWFKTGDIVEIKNNTLWIKGRVKDTIINESGENVYPDELEEYFAGLPGINSLCVLGTSKSREYENITLVLGMERPNMTNYNLSKTAEKVAAINSALPLMKKIGKVYVTSQNLPLTSSLKVKRYKLREMIEENKIELVELDLKNKTVFNREEPVKVETNVNLQWEEELWEIKNKMRKCFSEILGVDEKDIRDDADFVNDLGGDSLTSIGLRIKIEELFDLVIPDADYYQCSNLHETALLILRKTRGLTALRESAAAGEHSTEDIKIITSFKDSHEYKSFLPRLQQTSEEENPYFVCHDSVLRDVSMVDGKVEVLNFGSYNYVGMSGHPETVRAACEAAQKYGTSASGSRLLTGEKHLYKELESEIARWKHTEDALVLVGGHSTNVTFVGNFCNERDLILYDALAHNSIVQGCQLSRSQSKAFPHNDFNALESILKNARKRYEKILVVIEGAYSMDGDIAPVPEFVKLKKEHGFFLMVDEAHSACVIGEYGGGVDEYFNLEPRDIDIKMGTLSKGLGTCGGYLAGDKALIDYLRYNVPGFVFSVGISPPVAAATLQAVRIMQRDNSAVKSLHQNIKTFVAEARKRKLNICLAGETAVIPVMIGKEEDSFRISQLLLRRGVSVPPAVYPAVPKGQARLRFCVTSEHKEEQIIRALDILLEAAGACGVKIQGE